MNKQIPIYFDTIILNSPAQQISLQDINANRLKVGVFTKYKNRNGSYITDEYADFLIKSATRGNCPVVGFFDQQEKTWAGHTGPSLANGYGYVESFEGWIPFTDSDGITRDYATFSVVLFTDYYEEAQKIYGQNQSMELNPKTITGEWVNFDGEEYFVYKTGDIRGLCVIGAHEPCFSASSFFTKNDDPQFSSLLFKLKALVEEAEKNTEGGEEKMNEFENQEQKIVEPSVKEEEEQKEVTDNFEEQVVEENKEPEQEEEVSIDFEQQFNELQNSFNELKANYENAQNRISELEQFQNTANEQIESLQTENKTLKDTISNYELQIAAAEEEKKNSLFEKYEKIISDAEKINVIKEQIKNFSYDELESKLAVIYANQQMAGSENNNKVPLPEPPESQFALLMKKYHK